MGITYSLLKIDKGESFDLGKGMPWTYIFSYENPLFILPNLYGTLADFADWIDLEFDFDGMVEAEHREWAEMAAGKIWDWCGLDRIFFVNDYDDYAWNPSLMLTVVPDAKFISGKYIETGNRYR